MKRGTRQGRGRGAESPVSLRLPREIRVDLAETAGRRRESRSGLAGRLLEEGLKMQRIPGICFADAPSGRRPCVMGTGMSVWEVVWLWRRHEKDESRLLKAFPQLRPFGLRAALAYLRAYPDEVDAAIREHLEEAASIEALYPLAQPAP